MSAQFYPGVQDSPRFPLEEVLPVWKSWLLDGGRCRRPWRVQYTLWTGVNCPKRTKMNAVKKWQMNISDMCWNCQRPTPVHIPEDFRVSMQTSCNRSTFKHLDHFPASSEGPLAQSPFWLDSDRRGRYDNVHIFIHVRAEEWEPRKTSGKTLESWVEWCNRQNTLGNCYQLVKIFLCEKRKNMQAVTNECHWWE